MTKQEEELFQPILESHNVLKKCSFYTSQSYLQNMIKKITQFKSQFNILCLLQFDVAKEFVILKSLDNKLFKVHKTIVVQSQHLEAIIDNPTNFTNDVIYLPNIRSEVLQKVIEYCKYNIANEKASQAKVWNDNFLKKIQ